MLPHKTVASEHPLFIFIGARILEMDITAEKRRIINSAFTDLNSPASYSSINNVLSEARKKNRSITRAEVRAVLEENPTYSKHKPRRLRFPHLKTIPAGFMTDVQVDLADMQKIASDNDNFKYILVGVDVLSRRLFAAPTKSKASNHMIAAFKKLFKQMPTMPWRIFSDKGVEFQAHELKSFYKQNNIDKLVAQNPDVKAGVAERFIRTLKARLYKYFSQNKTERWLDALPRIVDSINNTKSRATGMKPNDINFNNAHDVWERLYGEAMSAGHQKPKYPKYKKNDSVRIAKQKKYFEKSYLPNYTEEVFTIDKVKRGKPQTYELKDDAGEDITGLFYNEELSKTRRQKDKKLRIENVIRERKRRGQKEYLVKLRGEEKEIWVNEKDLL